MGLSDLIPATPGWRVCVWSREQGGAIALPVVAWECGRFYRDIPGNPVKSREYARPWILTEFGEEVSPLPETGWFVAIMPPGSELADYLESAEQVAKAEEEAEEREERKRLAAQTSPSDGASDQPKERTP